MASDAKGMAAKDLGVDDDRFDGVGDQRPMTFTDFGFTSEDELEAYIQEGEDSFARDGCIPHHVVMAEMRAIIDKHRR